MKLNTQDIMKRLILRITIILGFLFTTTVIAFADSPPPPPGDPSGGGGNPPVGGGAPIGEGIVFMGMMAVAYGAKKWRNHNCATE